MLNIPKIQGNSIRLCGNGKTARAFILPNIRVFWNDTPCIVTELPTLRKSLLLFSQQPPDEGLKLLRKPSHLPTYAASCSARLYSHQDRCESHKLLRTHCPVTCVCTLTQVIIIIIIIIIINCNWVDTRWQWLFYMYTKYDIDYY
jgi:hypothetical protein